MGKTLSETFGPEWAEVLGGEVEKLYMQQIAARVVSLGDLVRPAKEDIFNAYKSTQPSQVRVVIVGQDPYPGNEAMGLSFSSKQQSIPPSLRVMFKELERSGMGKRTNPNLQDWADQGVLMLNSVLTTTYRISNAHQNWGWQEFTMATLRHLNTLAQPIAYLSWGKPAIALVDKALAADLITENLFNPPKTRLLLTSCHPQAENFSGGKMRFTGNEHFTLVNMFFKDNPIKWV
jgi:uracil-DNA glycosylase